MGLRVLHKRKLLIAGILALISCSGEDVPCTGGLRIEAVPFDGATKSLLGGSQIEEKITGVTLAAYSRGHLYRCTYTSGNGASIPFKLENGEEYTVYALVNTGDSRSLFPEYESDVPDMEYALTSYDSGENSVLNRGIPMAGSTTLTGGGSISAINVSRLLAKVTAHVECSWPDAHVELGLIGNMNGKLRPFGESAMEGPLDGFSFQAERHTVSGGGESADLVFYVPENMQGRVEGITSSDHKTHQGNASVDARKDCLTYMEVQVSGSGVYNGEIRYRSYLGANSTDSFDIVRNCAYHWTLTFDEDGLGTDSWKKDNHLDDLRELNTAGPLYVVPGESVSLKDYVSTNMPLGSIGWSISDNENGDDMLKTVVNAQDLEGVSFIVENHGLPLGFGNRVVSIQPKANPRSGLGGNMDLYVVDELISWRSTLNGKYFVTPGRQVEGDVDYQVSYMDDIIQSPVTLSVKGKGGVRWNYTGGVSPTLLGDTGKEYDQILFSPQATCLPGDYPITATTIDGSASSATLHVNDTRSIRWTNRRLKVPAAGDGFIAYRYLSENKIVVFLEEGGKYSTVNGEGFTTDDSPFVFIAGDRSIKLGDSSQNTPGVPFEGQKLLANNYTNRISISYDGPITTGSVQNYTLLGRSVSGNLVLIPKINTNLSNSSTYSIKIKAQNGYSDDTRHEIEAHIRVGSGYLHELALTPAISKVTAGASVNLTPTFYRFRVVDDELTVDSSMELVPASSTLTWFGAFNGIFTASEPGNYRVYATYTSGSISCTGYADIEVTSSDMDVWSDWDNSGTTVLD